MPTLKGSLILEGGSESHPQEISGIKLYNEEGKYSDGIQAGGASNGATYIELNQMQLGESTASGNTNNYETGINIKGGANLSATGSNLNATVNGIEVGTGESAGVITVGEGTTLIGETGAGISNVGTIEKIKDEGTIAGGDYGVDNAGNIGNIVGGTPTEAEGVIEGVHVGVNNTNSIGNIEYLSMIKGTYLGGGTGFSSFGVYNRGGTIGDIIGSASTKTEGTIEGAFAGIFNSGKIENIEYLSMIKGTYEEGDYPSYGIYNVATIGDIVGGTNLKKAGSIEGFVSGIYNHGGGAIGTVEYFSTIEGTGSASLFLVSGINNFGTIGKIVNSGKIIGSSMGIENNSTDNIGEIVNTGEIVSFNGSIGIENRGKIGSSEVEYGIKNEGIIEDILGPGDGVVGNGVVEGSVAGIYNTNTIGSIYFMSKIEGTGDSSYGIENLGTMGGVRLNGLGGSLYGIYNDGGTVANWNDIVDGTAYNNYTGTGSKYGSSVGNALSSSMNSLLEVVRGKE